MACCCHEQCIPYGSDSCCVYEQQHEQPPRRMTMLERQGIFHQPKPIPNACTPQELYRTQPKQYWHPGAFLNPKIPSIRITEDETGPFRSSHSNLEVHEGKIVRGVLWMTEARHYDDNRGPIIKIQGRTTEAILTYKEFTKLDKDGMTIDAKHEDYSEFYPAVEDLYISEEFGPFSTTTMCKQMRTVTIKNEGTTAVRFQWLRFPPTRTMRRILARPGSVLNIKKLQPPDDEPLFWKDDSFEFHFQELPGVIQPGQSIQFPIIFRPRRNGYFNENLYLLTHPRLTDEDDKIFQLKLSGVCMDPDCPMPHSRSPECSSCEDTVLTPEIIKKQMSSKLLSYEARDCLHSLLDRLLYSSVFLTSTLPSGRLTVEQIFCAHNQHLLYRYGTAEKAMEITRKLVTSLVPKDKIINNENICPLSIPSLYKSIALTPVPTEFFWSNFKNPETEKELEELSQLTNRLIKPRVFSWSTIDQRLHSACYTTLVTNMDEITAKISNIDKDSHNKDMDKVLKLEIRERLTKKKQKEWRRKLRREERKRRKHGHKNHMEYYERGDAVMAEDTEYEGEGYITHSSVARLPPIIIPDEEIEEELKKLKTLKETQAKQILFETLLGFGIERMLIAVDSYRAMYDYSDSKAILKCESALCSK